MSAKINKLKDKESNDNVDQDSRTFLRWTNNKLKLKSLYVRCLQVDLSDGTILLDLLECLRHKKSSSGTIRQSSNNRQQQLERVLVVIDMMKVEGVEIFSEVGKFCDVKIVNV